MRNKTTRAVGKLVAHKGESRPTVRFPEFREAGWWPNHFGNEVFALVKREQHDGSLPLLAVTQEHGAIPRDMIDYHVSVTAKSVEDYQVVEKGDFIISLRSFQGGIEHSEYRGICSPAYVILTLKKGSGRYFRHFVKTDRFIRQLNKNLEGLRDGKMVSYRQLSELLLPSPSIPEQEKIAACLSSIDELIDAERRKLSALKAHKKALLQQLFPAEGETIPRLRFPEFQSEPDWKEAPLSSHVHLVSGLHLLPTDYGATGEVPYFTGPTDFTNEEGCATKWTHKSQNTAANRDTLITVKGSGVGQLWYLTLPSVAIGRQLMAVRAKQSSNRFIYQVLTTRSARFKALASGNLIPGLSRSDILNMRFHFPSVPEQERVAACLSGMDVLIAAQTSKIGILRSHKKGLMQQLFPVLDEMQEQTTTP